MLNGSHVQLTDLELGLDNSNSDSASGDVQEFEELYSQLQEQKTQLESDFNEIDIKSHINLSKLSNDDKIENHSKLLKLIAKLQSDQSELSGKLIDFTSNLDEHLSNLFDVRSTILSRRPELNRQQKSYTDDPIWHIKRMIFNTKRIGIFSLSVGSVMAVIGITYNDLDPNIFNVLGGFGIGLVVFGLTAYFKFTCKTASRRELIERANRWNPDMFEGDNSNRLENYLNKNTDRTIKLRTLLNLAVKSASDNQQKIKSALIEANAILGDETISKAPSVQSNDSTLASTPSSQMG